MSEKKVTRGWTQEQKDLLIETYTKDNMTLNELSLRINKSSTSICNMAKSLNLKKRIVEWTEEDDEFLIRVYKEFDNTLVEIAEGLGRTVGSVQFRANKLGLKRQSESEYLRGFGKKRCNKCRQVLFFNEFITNNTMVDNIGSYCIVCYKVISAERIENKRAKANAKFTNTKFKNVVVDSAVTTKQCSECKEVKPTSEFYSKGGQCKECKGKYRNQRRLANLKEKGYCE